MTLGNWIYLATWTLTNFIIVVAAFYNLKAMVKDIETNHNNLKESFHLHEKQNEKSNIKLEQDIKYVREGVDYIKDWIINNKEK